MIGEALDVCAALLQVAVETRAGHGLIDGGMEHEMRFSYTCRQVNRLTLRPGSRSEASLDVYEVLGLRECREDEWMYQIATQDAGSRALTHWTQCWEFLPGGAEGAARTDPTAALRCLEHHMTAPNHDSVAEWLSEVLCMYQSGLSGRARRACVSGTLSFVMQFALPA
jgi:hypothetical protein